MDKPKTKTEVKDAISAFEQILDAMPNDRLALETLCDAYEQVGDRKKSLEYLLRLSKVLKEENDTLAMPNLLAKLRSVGDQEAVASAEIASIEDILHPRKPEPSEPGKRHDASKHKMVDISAELALAWNLAQAGVLTQEDYSNVVHDITESSTKNMEVPITVLHVLHDRSFKGLDKVLNHIAAESGLPLIPVGSFEPQKEAYLMLPMDYMMHRGAIVFEVMGRDLLVAILNPFDTELRDEVRKLTGRNGHFYLTTAESYDVYLGNVRKAIAAAEESAKKKA